MVIKGEGGRDSRALAALQKKLIAIILSTTYICFTNIKLKYHTFATRAFFVYDDFLFQY